MTGRTHLIVGIGLGYTVGATMGLNPFLSAFVGGIGGLLPDIDHPQSLISGWLPIPSLVLNLGGLRHRTWTHSLIFVAVTFLVTFYALLAFDQPTVWAYVLIVGVVAHLVCDAVTPSGIPLLFPLQSRINLLPRVIASMMLPFLEIAAVAVTLFIVIERILK